jgi:hypothetical protein
MLEVPLESHVFHLDVTLPKRFSKDEFVSRYIDSDLAAILEFIKDTNPVNTRLFVQTPHREDMPYGLREVLSVTLCTDFDGQAIFVCAGDEFQTLIAKSRICEPTYAVRQVWPRNLHAASAQLD